MANTITGGTAVSAGSAVTTWEDFVGRVRAKLNDLGDEPLWSNAELVDDYANNAKIEMSECCPMFKDATTSAICSIAVVEDDDRLAISDRITSILRAKLASDENPLPIVTRKYMDDNFSDWEDADSGDVQFLILDAETGYVRLYPPSEETTDTLTLTVTRIPATDIVYATDYAVTVDVPTKYLEALMYGVLYRAYGKTDVDTYDEKRMEVFKGLFNEGIERLKRSLLRLSAVDQANAPHPGFM